MSDSTPKPGAIRVLLVDDHPTVRQTFHSALQVYPNIEVVGEASDGEEALSCIAKVKPAVVLMDINMSRMDGVTATRLIKVQYPEIAVVALSLEKKEYQLHAMRLAGAFEVVPKECSVTELYGAMQRAVAAVQPVFVMDETSIREQESQPSPAEELIDSHDLMLPMRRWVYLKESDPDKWSRVRMRFQQLLDSAIRADGAAKGNAQFWNPRHNALEIVAHLGFGHDFLQHFEFVRVDEPSACGRAFRLGRRVMIADVTLDRFFQPYLLIAQASGFRAVQSTPIVRPDGVVIGVFSTHFPDRHEWDEVAQRTLDQYASQIAALVTELIESAAV
jgi:DNA-binding NarL/FixJ family response regulator